MSYIVKNYEKHQHYKDRRPPWIKLHRTLLDDCSFLRLQVASRALAPLFWLLASEDNDGIVKGDVKDIAFRLRLDENEVADGIKGLLSIDYISCYQDASNMLAQCKQETRVETEKEKEKDNIYPVRKKTRQKRVYSEEFEAFWNLYPNSEGKHDAYVKWMKIDPKPDISVIMDGLMRYCRSEKVANGFILNAERWIRGRRWEDGHTSPIKNSSPQQTIIEDTRKFTCPKCGKTGTQKNTYDAINYADQDIPWAERHGRVVCGFCVEERKQGEPMAAPIVELI